MTRNPGIQLSTGRYTTGTAGETVRKARKVYLCGDDRYGEGCGRDIMIGTFYIATPNPRGMYGNLTLHRHVDCEAAIMQAKEATNA